MFRTSSILALTAMVLAVYCLPSPQEYGSQCDTGSINCCDTTYPSNSTEGDLVMRSLGMSVEDFAPNTVVAAACGGGGVNVGGGSTCQQIPVCCENNTFGLIAVGCTVIPVTV